MPEAGEAVFDASALLAYLNDEPGAEAVEAALSRGGLISAVNWAEVLSKAEDAGTPAQEVAAQLTDSGILGPLLQVAPLDEVIAQRIAKLRPATREHGLSLADRACLALAAHLARPALTADWAWRHLEVGVEIVLIR